MKNLMLVGLVTLGMLSAVACGKPSKGSDADKAGETNTTSAGVGAAKASCDMSSDTGSCNEYRDGTTFGLEKSLCEGFKGKFTMAACPTSNQVGWCSLSEGEVKRYYGSGANTFTQAEAKADCESDLLKGKFTADPSFVVAPPAKPAAKTKKKK